MARAKEQHTAMKTVKNVTRCAICGGSGDKLPSSIYVCQSNPNHVAVGVVGIWSDLTDLTLPADTTP